MATATSTHPQTDAASSTLGGHAVDRASLPLLVTLALGVFAGALDLGVLSPALPALSARFSVGPSDAAWVFTLYLFANVLAIPVTAKLSDIFGRRSVYIACVGLFSAASLLAITAPTFALFLFARALQAAGAGGIFPVATAAIADAVPLSRRGAALGLLGAVWGLAAIVGPTVGGIVTHLLSWRWIFAANLPLGALVIVRARRYLPSRPSMRTRGPLDLAGMSVLSIALLALMVVLTRFDPRWGSFVNAGFVLAAVAIVLVATTALATIERRAAEPVLPPALFTTRQLRLTYFLEVLIGALEGALFFVPAALVTVDHVSISIAGLIAAGAAAVFVAVIPFAGRALDRFGSRIVLCAGTLCVAVGLGLFALFLTRLPFAVAALVVTGIGFGSLLGAPTRYIITSEAPATMRGTAVGLLSVLLIMGQIVGASLAGGILGNTAADVAGYRLAYGVFAGIGFVALATTLLLANQQTERRIARAS